MSSTSGKCFSCISSFSPHKLIIPLWQMKKLRRREVREFAKDQTVLVNMGFEVRTEGKGKDLGQGCAARLPVKFSGNASASACAVTPPLAEKNASSLSPFN